MRPYRTLITNLILIAQFLYILIVYPRLPTIIPNHFDANGIPQKHAPRAILWLLFLISLAVTTLLQTIAKHPNTFNLPSQLADPDRSRQTAIAVDLLAWIRLEIAVLFASIFWSIANGALHRQHNTWLTPAIAILILATAALHIYRMHHPPTA